MTRDPFLAPLMYLIATGALLGLATILAKIAPRAGLSPLAFLAWSVAGAALLLIVPRLLDGERLPVSRRVLEYYAIAALVSLAVPNFILFAAIPHIGVSFVALAIAFPPLLTYAGAVLLGIERFDIGRALGVGLALAGAALIAFLKPRLVAADMFRVIAVLLGPVLLSLLGAVAAVLAVPFAIIALGEAPPTGLVPGAALIASGIALVTIRQHRGRTLKQ